MVHRRRAAALAATGCLLAAASGSAAGAPAQRAVDSQSIKLSLGSVLGGVTSQGFAVMVEVDNPARVKRLTRMAAGVRLECAAGGGYTVADSFEDLKVDKRGRFTATWGPETETNDDGTTVAVEGVVRGRFNRDRDRVRGLWELQAVERDAAGAVTDTCDSGRITWRAKQ